jgi:hypothetical protein
MTAAITPIAARLTTCHRGIASVSDTSAINLFSLSPALRIPAARLLPGRDVSHS